MLLGLQKVMKIRDLIILIIFHDYLLLKLYNDLIR